VVVGVGVDAKGKKNELREFNFFSFYFRVNSLCFKMIRMIWSGVGLRFVGFLIMLIM
jgi:hypothetical protein